MRQIFDSEPETCASMLFVILREIQEGNKTLSQKRNSKTTKLWTSTNGFQSTIDGLLIRVIEA